MNAKHVMTKTVISVSSDAAVEDVAKLLIKNRISACPVADENDHLIGIISEADLIARTQSLPSPGRGWLQRLLVDSEVRASGYVRSYGRLVKELMTRDVVYVSESTPIGEIAAILRRCNIKRVPVVEDRAVVGIVSRSDLVRHLTEGEPVHSAIPARNDRALQAAFAAELCAAGVRTTFLHLDVAGGVVRISGAAESRVELQALRLAAIRVAGPTNVDCQASVLPPAIRSLLWAA